MTEQEYFVTWCEIQILVDTSLGLALLANHDCANIIADEKDRSRARDALHGAIAHLLKQAPPLLNSIDPMYFTRFGDTPSPT